MKERIGPYRILATLGEGGMGTVFLADQTHPVARRVALKLIKSGLDTRQVLARFNIERQTLALMEHPYIAKVLDAGETEDGKPYFVMEYVKGIAITSFCEQNQTNLQGRLELFSQVCEGVQHAHNKGVIHRDLKPSNILVTDYSGKAQVKIIDFGLAKATSIRFEDQSLVTGFGQPLGTPEYMSPEQADPSGMDMDTRTDVYSLGVILYELLTGSLPFTRLELARAGMLEVQRMICHDTPPKPSTRLSSLSAGAAVGADMQRRASQVVVRQIRGDLDWIVMKSLEKDRARRYVSPHELSADIQRHLSNQPVLAGPPSWTYHAKKLIVRHKVLVAALGTCLISLLGALIVSFAAYRKTSLAKLETETQKHIAEEHLGNFEKLSDLVLLEREQYEAVHQPLPCRTEYIERIEARYNRIASLVEKLPMHKALFDGLNQSSNPGTGLAMTRTEAARAFLAQSLRSLISGLEAVATPRTGLLARLDSDLMSARRIQAETVDSQAVLWAKTIASVQASPAYGRLVITPQLGLIPIGADPKSKLQEFAHWRSGEVPVRLQDGTVNMRPETAIVLVLVPGGTFFMGAQNRDRDGQNFDTNAPEDEGPVQRMTLRPFFVSKYEVTQAQWLRLTGTNPSFWNKERVAQMSCDLLPVESVTWDECMETMHRVDLQLPTEAQWEFCYRAGTTTPWWCGSTREDTRGKVNIADLSAKRAGASWPDINDWPDLDDGSPVTAAIGRYPSNAFGLHEMAGNVIEFCADDMAPLTLPTRAGDGLRLQTDGEARAYRGGSYASTVLQTRATFRFGVLPGNRHNNIGLRPCRVLEYSEPQTSRPTSAKLPK